MIVVADTAPLNYLIQIGCIDLLPLLYGSIVAPLAVMHELSNPSAPGRPLILIDEKKGRMEARRRGFMTTGKLGVLLTAGNLKLTDAEAAYLRLVAETSFRASESLEADFVARLRSSQ